VLFDQGVPPFYRRSKLSWTCFRNLQASFLTTAAVVLSSNAIAASPSGFTFTTIDFPGATYTIANGINNQGDIVGQYNDASGKSHGFLRHLGVFSSIDFPGALGTVANGINVGGDIVGSYSIGTADSHGFLLRGGVFATVDPPGGTFIFANGINTAGDIVGGYGDSVGNHGFLLMGGVYTTLDYPYDYCCSTNAKDSEARGINRLGDIVGQYLPFLNAFGYLFQAGVFTSIQSSSEQTVAYGINAQGDIVGTVFDAIGQNGHGLRLSGGVLTLFDFPSTTSGTVVHGINDQGDIVGSYQCGLVTCMLHGFVANLSGAGAQSVFILVNAGIPSPAVFNIDSEGALPVAILGSANFDATTIDPTSVRFGPKGAKNKRAPVLGDVNKDGKPDLTLYFAPVEAGVGCTDTSVGLTGMTVSKQAFAGAQNIKTTHTFPCPRR
jgi:uncharacterized membrane protein